MRDEAPKRRSVPLDAIGLSDLAREQRLSAHELLVLLTIAARSEFRSHEWTGTYLDLADHTRLSRNTVPRAVAGLVKRGDLEEVEPFRQGADSRMLVVVRDRIIVARRLRQAEPAGPRCDRCGEPVDGHPFNGHEPEIVQSRAISSSTDRTGIAR